MLLFCHAAFFLWSSKRATFMTKWLAFSDDKCVAQVKGHLRKVEYSYSRRLLSDTF